MRTIKISDAVWEVIEKNGKFRETEDDVLRRLLKLPDGRSGTSSTSGQPRAWKERRATVRMTQTVIEENRKHFLMLRFDSGETGKWTLPPKDDTSAIRKVRDEAMQFVKRSGGTKGQEHAAIRALTSRGYYVTNRTEIEFE